MCAECRNNDPMLRDVFGAFYWMTDAEWHDFQIETELVDEWIEDSLDGIED